MTNTRFIGNMNEVKEFDRLQARRGYKAIMITNPDKQGNVKVAGPHYYTLPYGFSADSTCEKQSRQSHDFVQCDCGFYSYTDPNDAISHYFNECGGWDNQILVEVALSQKVVVCDKGFRSSHQRVTRMLMPGCWNCEHPGSFMVPHASGYLVVGCQKCITELSLENIAITFDDFSAQHSPEGFNPIAIASKRLRGDRSKYVTNGKVNHAARTAELNLRRQSIIEYLNPSYSLEKANEWVKKMVESGDLKMLQQLQATVQSSIEEMQFEHVAKSLEDLL